MEGGEMMKKFAESSEYLRGVRAGLIEAQSAAAELCGETAQAAKKAQIAYSRITARLELIDLRVQETLRMENMEEQ
jgi:hypothetical protein